MLDKLYVNSENQQGGQTNGKSYVINGSLPEDYQKVVQELEKTQHQNEFLKEKIHLLEKRISDLEAMNTILKNI